MAQEVGTRKKQINKYNETLLDLTLNDTFLKQFPTFVESEYFSQAQHLLDDIHEHTYRGAQIRSKLYTLQDETPTHHFLTLESSIQGAKEIKQIHNEHGRVTTDPANIAHIFEKFYVKLFTRKDTIESYQNNFLQYCKPITHEDKDSISLYFSREEIEDSIKDLNSDSSPGPDGLTSNFYKYFCKEISIYLERFYLDIFKNKYLPESHKMSFITLLSKDCGSPLDPKNYRPISLLNTEYKILTSMLSKRLSLVMPKIIHSDQVCSIKSRNISDHLHFIRDLISYSQATNYHCCILSIDQSKAFDSVSHDWLRKVISQYNLGDFILGWFNILYTDVKSKIIINNTLTGEIAIGRGVRQGDPLSPLLYILCIEPLLEKIRCDIKIPPVIIPGGHERKIAGYADDANFFLTRHSSINLTMNHFNDFSHASGSTVNFDKTKILALGSWKKYKININFDLQYVDVLRILGLFFTRNIFTCGLKNWEMALKEIELSLNRFYYKKTSIFGRAVIINTKMEPKLLYPLHIFDPPTFVFKKYNQLIRAFIFKGTISTIKQSTLFLPKEKGGIGLHSLELKHIAFRMKSIYKFIHDAHKYPFLYYYFSFSCRKYIDFDNKRPHYTLSLPMYYATCKKVLDKYDKILLDKKPQQYYKALIDKHSNRIDMDIKRLHFSNRTEQIFPNLHKTKKTTPMQKQIAYRLIFNFTPTSEGEAKKRNKKIPCTLCNLHQETEEHIFYSCPKLETLKLKLIELLRQPHNTLHDPYKAIFLNIYVHSNKITAEIRNIVLAVYRETVWLARIRSKFNNRRFTRDSLTNTFMAKLRKQLDTHVSLEDWEEYYANT